MARVAKRSGSANKQGSQRRTITTQRVLRVLLNLLLLILFSRFMPSATDIAAIWDCIRRNRKHPVSKVHTNVIEHSGGFQKLDTVEMTTKNGKFVGCINTFDNTLDGKPQKLRIKTDWTDGDGRKSGNINQLRHIQKRDGYAYQTLKAQPDSENVSE